MINWPLHLIKELSDRRAVIFTGSGISASATGIADAHPPEWEKFLEGLAEGLDSEDQNATLSLIKVKDYLTAAEIISSKLPHGDFDARVRSLLVTPRFKSSEVHAAIQAIDTKIVITTNYDQIYERLCTAGDAAESYSVIRYHDSNLVTELRSSKRLIIKAHGCVTQMSRIVLSKSSYFKARSEYRNFYSAMDGLFIVNTLLFVGYSLSDPDITLLLENANISAPSDNVHYCVMQDNLHPAIMTMLRSAYNLHVLTFPAGNFDYLRDSLINLAKLVQDTRSNPAE